MLLKSAEARSIIGKKGKIKAPAIAGAFLLLILRGSVANKFPHVYTIFLQLAIDNSPKKEYSVLKQEQFKMLG